MTKHEQRGYTLLELMVVLSILTVFVAVSFPVLLKPLRKSQVQQAAQDVAETIMTARVWAIERGEVYSLVYAVDGSQYELKPLANEGSAAMGDVGVPDSLSGSKVVDSTDELSIDESVGTLNGDAGGKHDVANSSKLTLPTLQEEVANGVRFANPSAPEMRSSLNSEVPQPVAASGVDQAGRERTVHLEGRADDAPVPAVNWSEPILFYPDGRSQNESIKLVAEDGYRIELTIRGLTGSVLIGAIEKHEPALHEQVKPARNRIVNAT